MFGCLDIKESLVCLASSAAVDFRGVGVGEVGGEAFLATLNVLFRSARRLLEWQTPAQCSFLCRHFVSRYHSRCGLCIDRQNV